MSNIVTSGTVLCREFNRTYQSHIVKMLSQANEQLQTFHHQQQQAWAAQAQPLQQQLGNLDATEQELDSQVQQLEQHIANLRGQMENQQAAREPGRSPEASEGEQPSPSMAEMQQQLLQLAERRKQAEQYREQIEKNRSALKSRLDELKQQHEDHVEDVPRQIRFNYELLADGRVPPNGKAKIYVITETDQGQRLSLTYEMQVDGQGQPMMETAVPTIHVPPLAPDPLKDKVVPARELKKAGIRDPGEPTLLQAINTGLQLMTQNVAQQNYAMGMQMQGMGMGMQQPTMGMQAPVTQWNGGTPWQQGQAAQTQGVGRFNPAQTDVEAAKAAVSNIRKRILGGSSSKKGSSKKNTGQQAQGQAQQQMAPYGMAPGGMGMMPGMMPGMNAMPGMMPGMNAAPEQQEQVPSSTHLPSPKGKSDQWLFQLLSGTKGPLVSARPAWLTKNLYSQAFGSQHAVGIRLIKDFGLDLYRRHWQSCDNACMFWHLFEAKLCALPKEEGGALRTWLCSPRGGAKGNQEIRVDKRGACEEKDCPKWPGDNPKNESEAGCGRCKFQTTTPTQAWRRYELNADGG